MKKKSRSHVLRQLRKTVNGYTQCTSILNEHLGQLSEQNNFNDPYADSNKPEISKVDPNVVSVIENINENIDTIDEVIETVPATSNCDDDTFDIFNESSSESIRENSEVDSVCDQSVPEIHKERNEFQSTNQPSESDSNIPQWLLDFARQGKIQSCVIDILHLNQYFFPPQVEDYSLPSSHSISLPILSAIVGLLLGKCDKLVKYWTRNGSHLDWYTVEPMYETSTVKFPFCDEVFNISEAVRKTALLEVTDIIVDLTLIPEEWQLFSVAIIFWLKNMEYPKVTESHLHTMVMCFVAIYTIDAQIGVHRNKQTFTRKYKNLLNKIIDNRNKEKSVLNKDRNLLTDKGHDFSSVSPNFQLAKVSHDDCVLVFETILPFYHLSEQIKIKPKNFCLSTVHAFAQFQSCLFHLMVLNSVLGFPMKQTTVSQLYSGTFVYNVFTNFSKRNNIIGYVEHLFHDSPTLNELYTSIVHLFETGLVDVVFQKKTAKTHKRKRKQEQNQNLDIGKLQGDEDDNDEEFFDENNMFSRLSLT